MSSTPTVSYSLFPSDSSSSNLPNTTTNVSSSPSLSLIVSVAVCGAAVAVIFGLLVFFLKKRVKSLSVSDKEHGTDVMSVNVMYREASTEVGMKEEYSYVQHTKYRKTSENLFYDELGSGLPLKEKRSAENCLYNTPDRLVGIRSSENLVYDSITASRSAENE